jgi:hypothetical protein
MAENIHTSGEKLYNYKSIVAENGLASLEGNELDTRMDNNLKFVAYQIDMKNRSQTGKPYLKIVLRDSRRNDNIDHVYFFDDYGGFVKGYSQGFNGEDNKYFKHQKVENLEHLIEHSDSIVQMLEGRIIPEPLRQYEVIGQIRNDSLLVHEARKALRDKYKDEASSLGYNLSQSIRNNKDGTKSIEIGAQYVSLLKVIYTFGSKKKQEQIKKLIPKRFEYMGETLPIEVAIHDSGRLLASDILRIFQKK